MPVPRGADRLPDLARLALPVVISFTTRFLFQLVDLVYAAWLRDQDAVAAIGFYIPFQIVHIALWAGLSAGFTAALSRAIGRRDEARVRALKRAMLRILLVVIPVVSLLGVVTWSLIPQFGLAPGLRDAFSIYGGMLLVWLPWTSFWAIWPDSVVKAHYDTRTTMYAGFATAVGNVVLNSLFVFVFELGLFGIALATVISRLGGFSWSVRRALELERTRAQPGWDLTPPPEPRGAGVTILSLGVPSGLTHVLAAIEGGIVNRLLLLQPDSTTAIASYGVYHQMLNLSLMPAVATSLAVLPFVARLLPEGEHAHVRSELRRIARMLALGSLVLTLVIGWVLARPLTGYLIPPDDHDGAAVQEMAIEAFRLLPLAALATFPFVMLRPVFEASGHPRRGIGIAIVRFLGASLGLIAGARLGPELGLHGLTGMLLGLILALALVSLLTRALAHALLAEHAAE